ncbi:hypothetical protein TW95_gp0795 [Pandoravirus inopinatum]|uniref:Uncharacterized protein n=1 Tax=Pandoravirus inopinatum TaxID=1605721 RepID=A0A0B5J1V2_9VIRU|nr:hypothetical protein TW95_gp0795 [Pandoravirus inopinatum]AJF97529.1 hypothetical protein [Pandoravirus inopinatum]
MDQRGHIREQRLERPLSIRPSTLFALCVRAVVPFAVVEAALQAQLPMLASINDVLDSADTMTDRVDHCRPWWVSVVHRWDSPHPSAGWLEPITTRDAMRIALHHWAYLYAERRCLPCEPWPTNDFDDGTDRGLHHVTWRIVTGNDVYPWEDPVIVVRDLGMRMSRTTVANACIIRDSAVAHSRRIPHPRGQSICMYYTGWTDNDCDRLVGWICDDPGFLVYIKRCHLTAE